MHKLFFIKEFLSFVIWVVYQWFFKFFSQVNILRWICDPEDFINRIQFIIFIRNLHQLLFFLLKTFREFLKSILFVDVVVIYFQEFDDKRMCCQLRRPHNSSQESGESSLFEVKRLFIEGRRLLHRLQRRNKTLSKTHHKNISQMIKVNFCPSHDGIQILINFQIYLENEGFWLED